MKTKSQLFDEAFEGWAEIVDSVHAFTGLPKDELLDRELLPRNIRYVQKQISANPKDFLREYKKGNDALTVAQYITNQAYKVAELVNKHTKETENCISIDISYKDEKITSFEFSLDQYKELPGIFELLIGDIQKFVSAYCADEEFDMKYMDESKKTYYSLFGGNIDQLRTKLRIWKENYPKAYKKLTTEFEIPTYEEVLEEIKNNQNESKNRT